MSNIKEIIKATLFVSGEGVEKKDIAEKLGLTDKQLSKYIEQIKQELAKIVEYY